MTVKTARKRKRGGGPRALGHSLAKITKAVFGKRGDDDPPEGKVLFMEKRHVTDAASVFEFIVDEEPRKAGIDPFHKLVDRNPSNNMTNVTVAKGG